MKISCPTLRYVTCKFLKLLFFFHPTPDLALSWSSIQGNEILKYRVSIRVFVRLRKHLSQAFHYLSQDMIDDGSFDVTNLMHRSVLLTRFSFFLFKYIFTCNYYAENNVSAVRTIPHNFGTSNILILNFFWYYLDTEQVISSLVAAYQKNYLPILPFYL